MRYLWVNAVKKQEPTYLLVSPAVTLVSDFKPVVLHYKELLQVEGSAFKIGEHVTLYLDSIRVSDSNAFYVAGDYHFTGFATIPNISDRGIYHLVAIGDSGSKAVASDLVYISRTLDLEFEDMVAEAKTDSGSVRWKNMSEYWYTTWSKQTFAAYDPVTPLHKVTFTFRLPVADTFKTELHLTKGQSYGNYAVSLDGKKVFNFRGYYIHSISWQDPHPSDTIRLGTVFLDSGIHQMSFYCSGKDTLSKGYLLGADLLKLTPVTIMYATSGWDLEERYNYNF